MELDLKLVSKEINEMLWRNHKTLSTAESCTAGRIGSVITAVPGSSNYYKGGIICYADEIKEELLKVDELFHTDYAVAISGFAGPGGPDGGRSGVIVGTIWIAVGNKDNIITTIIEEDNGRDKNLASATNIAMHMLRDYLKENCEETEVIE